MSASSRRRRGGTRSATRRRALGLRGFCPIDVRLLRLAALARLGMMRFWQSVVDPDAAATVRRTAAPACCDAVLRRRTRARRNQRWRACSGARRGTVHQPAAGSALSRAPPRSLWMNWPPWQTLCRRPARTGAKAREDEPQHAVFGESARALLEGAEDRGWRGSHAIYGRRDADGLEDMPMGWHRQRQSGVRSWRGAGSPAHARRCAHCSGADRGAPAYCPAPAVILVAPDPWRGKRARGPGRRARAPPARGVVHDPGPPVSSS